MKKATILVALLMLAGLSGAEVPNLIGFQGQLTESGNPVDGDVEISFKIYNVATGGSPMWTEVRTVTVSDGRYSILLGSETTLEGLEFFGDRWLALHVTGQSEMTPRYRLATSPYSMRSRVADSVASIPVGLVDSTKLHEESISLLNISGGGASLNQVLKWTGDEWAPFEDLTGAGYDYWERSGNLVFLGDTLDSVSIRSDSAVADLFVEGNTRVTGNFIGGQNCTIDSSFYDSGILSGLSNRITSAYAFIGGGYLNTAYEYSAVGGGEQNLAFGNHTFIGGGAKHQVFGNYGCVLGGDSCYVGASHGVVVGGQTNRVNDQCGAIVGGYANTASYYGSVVGGMFNNAGGNFGAVPGGYGNQADGNCSFAAGQNAKALHWGTYVWADRSTSSQFPSTDSNQYLIRAAGGVGIGTATPAAQLDVNGSIRCVSLTQTSDARYKKNLRKIQDPIQKLSNLEGVEFEWDQKVDSTTKLSSSSQIGLLAQEVEKQFPQLVATDKNGLKSVDYGKLTAVLLEAIKELNARLAELEQKQ